ncbi:hypothetical protein PVAP13_9NG590900 [Panicum virgatum]|uniref:Uncharacterized protein n=1 Tax=Panicum virgatum TaxID=38727 RepID=A0A8T0N152_PANVG|nr:hypothetical protein PVAP13_9NG590900 [Panicum virgatum]
MDPPSVLPRLVIWSYSLAPAPCRQPAQCPFSSVLGWVLSVVSSPAFGARDKQSWALVQGVPRQRAYTKATSSRHLAPGAGAGKIWFSLCCRSFPSLSVLAEHKGSTETASRARQPATQQARSSTVAICRICGAHSPAGAASD